MRISTSNAHERGLSTLQQRQAELSKMQEQLTSAERAMASKMRVDADQRALESSRTVVTLAESALSDAGELLQQAREHMIAAGNATYTDTERAGLADAIQGIRDQLLSIANRSNGSGGYLFGGQGSSKPPFVDAPGGVQFQGLGGETLTASGEPLPLSLDGGGTWLQAIDPATGAPDLSVFDVLDRVVAELRTPGRTGALIASQAQDGVRELDAATDHLLSHRSRLGETLNRTDSVEVRLSQQALAAQSERSAAEDLDMVQAVSEFQNQQTGYDAALQAYAMVQRMSLFQYIR
jgi:flagellar hook-associated protein 3 FlgL